MRAIGRRHGSLPTAIAENAVSGGMAFDPVDALDCLAYGVIVADHATRPLLLNRTAAEILAEADGLHLEGARLAAAERRETAAMRAAVAAISEDVEEGSGALTISRPSLRRSLVAFVLPTRAAGWSGTRRNVVVFVRDPERSELPPTAVLRRLYGLTAAEAEAAVEIARGEGLPKVAKKLGLSQTTVRTHLQRIFSKTGTCKQAQLAWLVAETCGLLRLGSPRSDVARRSLPALRLVRFDAEGGQRVA
jgi:DNA-binding CsgD family transcriptional regulator